MTQNPNLAALSAAGVSVWLDDLSRERLQTGNLQELIDTKSVVGVTTNPTIFQKALSRATPTTSRSPSSPSAAPTSTPPSARSPPTTCARHATCCARSGRPPTASTAGSRSRSTPGWRTTPTRPTLQAIELWKIVDRPNLLIKIPATKAGLPAITSTLAEGISVNVTLIFSVERHREVMDAYLAGLEAAKAGRPRHLQDPFGRIVLRLPRRHRDRQAAGEDRLATKRWRCAGRPVSPTPAWLTPPTRRCSWAGERFEALKADGARVQRPLWASTGVKNPDYSDTLYVTELVAPNTVNTMPEKTIDAVADHGVITGDTVTGRAAEAQAVFDKLDAVGIDLRDVFLVLEDEGVEKFEKSWQELLDATQEQLDAAKK